VSSIWNGKTITGTATLTATIIALTVLIGAGAASAAATPVPAQEADTPTLQAASLVIANVTIDGAASTITISNAGSAAVSLSGLWICNAPNYWTLPDLTLGAGESITVHAGSGTDSASQIYAGGGFGNLGSPGEIALYTGPEFSNPDLIIGYVGWNGGGGRKSVAQAAGLWGDDDIAAEVGDTIRRIAAGSGADAYAAGDAQTIAALPSTGSGGLAGERGNPSPLLWAAIAAAMTLLVGLTARQIVRTHR